MYYHVQNDVNKLNDIAVLRIELHMFALRYYKSLVKVVFQNINLNTENNGNSIIIVKDQCL